MRPPEPQKDFFRETQGVSAYGFSISVKGFRFGFRVYWSHRKGENRGETQE